jgi:hypothetical protein
MRRFSVVSGIAAAVVAGHLGYHMAPSRPPPPVAVGPGVASPSLVLATPALVEAPPAAFDAAPSPSVPCALQRPLTKADWKPMLDALRPLVARYELKSPDYARDYRHFVRCFELCAVNVSQTTDQVIVGCSLGDLWVGAHFRKTPGGWKALRLASGEIP